MELSKRTALDLGLQYFISADKSHKSFISYGWGSINSINDQILHLYKKVILLDTNWPFVHYFTQDQKFVAQPWSNLNEISKKDSLLMDLIDSFE